ncbi:MAG TPA: hypothetical protein VEP50_11305, partial [bacterium]|nr:hypothetical protein [bacterium]
MEWVLINRALLGHRWRSKGTAHRQVPVDWLDLEAAFEMHSDDSASFLDLRTGKVHYVPFDEEMLADAEEAMSEEAADRGLAEGWLVRVDPLESHDEYEWMAQFVASVDDPRLRELLEVALDGRG